METMNNNRVNKKSELKFEILNFLKNLFGQSIETKIKNIIEKASKYDVPTALYQNGTSRSNRVLIPWKDVYKNNMSLEQLNSFEGGIVVEFVNNDFFNPEFKENKLFLTLKNRLGGNENVSSIITIRNENGKSDSREQREAFNKLTNNFKLLYQNQMIELNKDNYKNYSIKRVDSKTKKIGVGNDKWEGFLFISIKGGQQDTIETHPEPKDGPKLFNPACEYASKEVALDIILVVSYFVLKAIENLFSLNENEFLKQINNPQKKPDYNKIKNDYLRIKKTTEEELKNTSYNVSDSEKGCLLEYCNNHPCLQIENNKLYDPIQVQELTIDNFLFDTQNENSIDLSHNEAVNKNRYYWDSYRRCFLTPTRPTNVFWETHLSNMIQQNYTLEEYFIKEEERVKRRKSHKKK